MKGNIKNYDEINRYDFYIKYYMQFAIGTQFEDCVAMSFLFWGFPKISIFLDTYL